MHAFSAKHNIFGSWNRLGFSSSVIHWLKLRDLIDYIDMDQTFFREETARKEQKLVSTLQCNLLIYPNESISVSCGLWSATVVKKMIIVGMNGCNGTLIKSWPLFLRSIYYPYVKIKLQKIFIAKNNSESLLFFDRVFHLAVQSFLCLVQCSLETFKGAVMVNDLKKFSVNFSISLSVIRVNLFHP